MNTKNMIVKVNAFLADENGGEVAEWAVVVAIVVAAAVTAYKGPLGTALNSAIAKVVSAMG